MSDLGNQRNNGHHQEQIFDNLCLALCLALREQKSDSAVVVGGGRERDTCTQYALYEGSRSFFSLCFSDLGQFEAFET